VRVRGLSSYRLAPAAEPPALVLGYGRLPVPSIEPVIALLARALSHERSGRGSPCPDSA
jgi:hypothetical protein